jgi:hypothetical protein
VSINNDTSCHTYLLTHTIRVAFQPTMKVNIYNQCLNFRLTDNIFFSTGGTTNEFPDWKVEAGNMTSFELIYPLAVFEGALSYELQREYVESSERFESTCIRLFVTWKSKGYKKLHACVNLVECDRSFDWFHTELEEYYQRYTGQLSICADPIKDTWLIYDDAILITELELNFTQKDGVLNIIISEGVRDDRIKRPVWIDPKR